jgi:mRNA-degrading endonuclease RelE of RelBE toxin-antitoxin system
MATRREIILAPKALEQMEAAHPSDVEREALRQILSELSTDPSRAYRVLFVNPPMYRIDAGRFRIHFRLTEQQVQVEFIGIY